MRICAAVIGFIHLNKTNWHVNVFKAVYTVMFGNLLLLYEMRGTAISFIVAPYLVFLRASPATLEKMFRSNFGFLYKSWGRAFYLVFCGFMPLGLGKLGQAAGGTMFAAAALNFIVIFKVRTTFLEPSARYAQCSCSAAVPASRFTPRPPASWRVSAGGRRGPRRAHQSS